MEESGDVVTAAPIAVAMTATVRATTVAKESDEAFAVASKEFLELWVAYRKLRGPMALVWRYGRPLAKWLALPLFGVGGATWVADPGAYAGAKAAFVELLKVVGVN